MLSVNKNWRKRGVGERVPPSPRHALTLAHNLT